MGCLAEQAYPHKLAPLPKQFGACFNRTAFPAIRVGMPMRMTCQIGKFHGMTESTVPQQVCQEGISRRLDPMRRHADEKPKGW